MIFRRGFFRRQAFSSLTVIVLLSGFLLSMCHPGSTEEDQCAGKGRTRFFTDRKGVIQTPNFPRRFPVPFQCRYVVKNEPSSIVVFTLTQMYLIDHVSLAEYINIRTEGDFRHIQQSTKLLPLGHTKSHKTPPAMAKSHSPFPAIEVDLRTLTNVNIRVFDNLLDVYGFNITYEIVAKDPKENGKKENGKKDAKENGQREFKEDGQKELWNRRNWDPNECVHPSSCSYNGHCFANADFSKYACSCFPGYEGNHCEKGSQCYPERGINPCQNGGTCSYIFGALRNKCTCKTGFVGPLCENNILEKSPVKGSSGIVCSVGLTPNANLQSVQTEISNVIAPTSADMFTIGYFQSRDTSNATFHLLFNNNSSENDPIKVSQNESRNRRRKSHPAPAASQKSDQQYCGTINQAYIQNDTRLKSHFVHVLKIESTDSPMDILINSAKVTFNALAKKVALRNSYYTGFFGCIFEKPLDAKVRISEMKNGTIKGNRCAFQLTSSETVVKEGGSFQLTCRAPYSSNRKFVWTKYDGKQIVTENSVRRMYTKETGLEQDGCFSSSLEIKESARLDSGVYECRVDDCLIPRGEEMKKKIFIEIEVKPRSYLQPYSASLVKGSNLTVSCYNAEKLDLKADGHFKWYKNGVLLDESQSETFEDLVPGGSILFVSAVEQSATYTCQVNNSVGTGVSDVIVTLLDNATCVREFHSNVTWNQTAAGARDIQRCPWGYLGLVTRDCEQIIYTYEDGTGKTELSGKWGEPNFSKCINFNFSNEVKLFIQHAIGYGRYEPDAMLRKLINTLQLSSPKDGVTDLQHGGGEMFLLTLAAVQEYCWRKEKPISDLFFEVLAILMSKPTNIINPQSFHSLIRLLEDQVSLRAAEMNVSSTEQFVRGDLKIRMEKSSGETMIFRVEAPDQCVQPYNGSVLQRPLISASIAYPDLDLKRFKHCGTFVNGSKTIRLEPVSFLNTTIQRNDYPFLPPHNHSQWSFLGVNLPYSYPKRFATIRSSGVNKNSDRFLITVRLSVGDLRKTPTFSFGCGLLNGSTSDELLWDMDNCNGPVLESGIAKCLCNSSGTFVLFKFRTFHSTNQFADEKNWAILFVGTLVAGVLISLSSLILLTALIQGPSILTALKLQFCISALALMIFSQQSYKSVDSQVLMYPVSDCLVNFCSSLCAATQLGVAVILFLELLEIARSENPSPGARLTTHFVVLPTSWGVSVFFVCVYISVWSASKSSIIWTATSPQFVTGCFTILLWLTAGSGILAYLRWMMKKVELRPEKRDELTREFFSVVLLFGTTMLFKIWRLFWLSVTKLPVCLILSLVCIVMGMATFIMYLILNFGVHTCFQLAFKVVMVTDGGPSEAVAQVDSNTPSENQQSKPKGSQRPKRATLPLLLRAGLGPEVQAAFESSSGSEVELPKAEQQRQMKRDASSSTNYPSARTELTVLSRADNTESAATLYGVNDPIQDDEDLPRVPHNTPNILPEPAKSLWVLDWQMATKAWHAVSTFRARSVTMSSERETNSVDVEMNSPESSMEFRTLPLPRQRNESSSSGISCRKQSVSSGSQKAGPSSAIKGQKRPVFIKWRDPELGRPAMNNNYNSSSSSSGEKIIKPYPGKCYLRCSPDKLPPPKKKPARNRIKAIDCGVQTSKELMRPFLSENEVIVEAVVEKTPTDEYVNMDSAGSLAVLSIPMLAIPMAFVEPEMGDENSVKSNGSVPSGLRSVSSHI